LNGWSGDVVFDGIKPVGILDNMIKGNEQFKSPSGVNVRGNVSEPMDMGSYNSQHSNNESQNGEMISRNAVTLGNDTEGSNSQNVATRKEHMQRGKRSTRMQRAFDAVNVKIQSVITSSGTKSVFHFAERPASALFDTLQAKVAARAVGEAKQTPFSWADAKLKIDMTGGSDAEQAEESMLRAAILDAAELDRDEEAAGDSSLDPQPHESSWLRSAKPHSGDGADASLRIEDQAPLDIIEFAPLTMKWLERADRKGREMLLRRVKRLAEGQRSYALSKRLQSTQNPIYEAKLGGQRVLWTKLKRGDTLSILVRLLAFVRRAERLKHCSVEPFFCGVARNG
jgi:hypothetical protein